MRVFPSTVVISCLVMLIAVLGFAACAQTTSRPTSAQPPTAIPPAAADAAVKVVRVQGFGLYLTDNANRTLYAYAKDSKDTSDCVDACTQNWPPFLAPRTPLAPSGINASLLGTFARPDGNLQVEYDGHPLYYFAGDKAPGDVKGQGVGQAWHVLSPRGNPMLNAYSPTGTPTP